MKTKRWNEYIIGDIGRSSHPIVTLTTTMNRVFDRDIFVQEYIDQEIEENPYLPNKFEDDGCMYEHITAETSERIK